MVLTAADVHGAFNLLNYNPDHCQLFAFPLSDEVTMIHMAGLCFSSTHAVSLILGLCHWYVDDLMAVSPISSYLTDSSKVDESVQHLLGEGSIAKQKSQCARQLEFLG